MHSCQARYFISIEQCLQNPNHVQHIPDFMSLANMKRYTAFVTNSMHHISRCQMFKEFQARHRFFVDKSFSIWNLTGDQTAQEDLTNIVKLASSSLPNRPDGTVVCVMYSSVDDWGCKTYDGEFDRYHSTLVCINRLHRIRWP